MTNPYARYVEGRDVERLLAETPEAIKRVVESWTPDRFRRSYAPGKWEGRQILLHLAHTELAFGMRVRMALATDGYVVQPFDQDAFVRAERNADGPAALRAYSALRELNLLLLRSLSAAERATRFQHPERGEITVQWVFDLLAGHDLHHLGQLRQI
jgi:hypothetical protein